MFVIVTGKALMLNELGETLRLGSSERALRTVEALARLGHKGTVKVVELRPKGGPRLWLEETL